MLSCEVNLALTLIVLDPGHGGHDSGATGYGLVEKNLALQIGLKVRDFLKQQYQVEVKMTRETDVFISLSGRADFANKAGAHYFVSLHHNAAGGEGFESFVYRGLLNSQTGRYQQVIHQEIMGYLGTLGVRDRGRKDADFAVIRETKMPAVLLENLFVDNPFDANLLKDPAVIDQLSQKIAVGIAKAFNLKELFPITTPDWKKEAVDWLFKEGLLTNEDWKKTVENPLPLWAEAVVLRRLYEKMKQK